MSDQSTAPQATPNAAPEASGPQNGRGKCGGGRGTRRRGWFLAGAAILTGLIGFGIGRATEGHWGHWGHGGFGMNQKLDASTAAARADEGISHILAEVSGTPEQKTKLNEIANGAIKDLLPMRDTFEGTREKLAAALKAEKIDRTAIEQLRTGQLTAADTASKRALQALTDAADVLTPAQRLTLVDRWQSWDRHSW